MKRATGTRFGPQRLALLAVSLVALAGCEEELNPQESSAEKAAREIADNTNQFELFPDASATNQRDVEAPEVFQVTEAGLWDGRLSLGDVWVAHPDVSQPERVLVKNTANNKSITGALFRRDQNLPGPALQVSSSAAERLDMLAGAPTRIQVAALRRETIEQASPPVAEEPTIGDASAADTESAVADTTDAPENPAKRKWWQKKEPSEITKTPLDPIEGAAAIEASEPSTPAEPVAAAATTTATTATGGLAKPYVQAGTFSVEANAKSAANKNRRNGMSAEVSELKGDDSTVWRVLVGPVLPVRNVAHC